jgi:hypothetical protein
MPRVVETKTHYQPKPPCRTAKQMTTLCCEDTAALQCCEKVEPWDGYTREEVLDRLGIKLDANGRDQRGRYVNIIRKERSRPCGEKRTAYDLSPKRCCEDVPALKWRDDVTPDVLPAGSSIIIAWEGSDGRETIVKTSSNATWFSDGRKTAIGYGNSIELFAGETFCGATSVTVSDGCSEATVVVRSDQGQWVLLGSTCGLTGATPTQISGLSYEAILGKYRQIETVRAASWMVLGLGCDTSGLLTPAPGYENTCFSGDCAAWFCGKVAAARPTDAVMDTCLGYDVASVVASSGVHHCTLPDGAIVNDCSITVYSCLWTNGSSGGGSRPAVCGHYLKSTTKTLYEWSC